VASVETTDDCACTCMSYHSCLGACLLQTKRMSTVGIACFLWMKCLAASAEHVSCPSGQRWLAGAGWTAPWLELARSATSCSLAGAEMTARGLLAVQCTSHAARAMRGPITILCFLQLEFWLPRASSGCCPQPLLATCWLDWLGSAQAPPCGPV